jgi:hypothetical protein
VSGATRPRADRVAGGVFLVAALYTVARAAGWTGGPAPLEFSEPLLIPVLIGGAAWGVWRLLRRPLP